MGSTAKLTVWLFIGLVIGSTTGVKGVVDYARPLQAILIVPIV